MATVSSWPSSFSAYSDLPGATSAHPPRDPDHRDLTISPTDVINHNHRAADCDSTWCSSRLSQDKQVGVLLETLKKRFPGKRWKMAGSDRIACR